MSKTRISVAHLEGSQDCPSGEGISRAQFLKGALGAGIVAGGVLVTGLPKLASSATAPSRDNAIPRGDTQSADAISRDLVPEGTVLTAVGDDWYINGTIVNEGLPFIEGQFLGARMVQALFDVETASGTNPTNYQYPDEVTTWTAPRDPDRNTAEFIAMIPTYRSYGLNMVTVGMQGGAVARGSSGWIIGGKGISAWNADGTMKAGWRTRLIDLLTAADENGLIVNLQCFYHNRDDVLTDATAVWAAMYYLIDVILDPAVNGVKHFQNVLFEVGNELGFSGASHTILAPDNMGTTITALKSYVSTNHPGKTLLFSCSMPGGATHPNDAIGPFDYISIHSNNDTPTDVISSVNNCRNKSNYSGCPIQITEDNMPFAEAEPTGFPNMVAAIENRNVGWGFYDQPDHILLSNPGGNYVDGFQSPPVNWSINTFRKQALFDAFAAYAGVTP
jgi:hypothetical protein